MTREILGPGFGSLGQRERTQNSSNDSTECREKGRRDREQRVRVRLLGDPKEVHGEQEETARTHTRARRRGVARDLPGLISSPR